VRTIYFEKNIPKILLVRTLRSLWPTIFFSRFSPTRFVEIAEEPLPGPRWVRVRNRLCGICATDLHLFHVETDPKLAAAALPGTERLYLGHEVCGEVSEVGPGVTTLKVGDRVTMDSRVVLHPTCLSQEIEPRCRHCQQGNYQLCENAALNRPPIGVGGGWGDSFTAHVTELYQAPAEFSDETVMMIEPLSVGVRSALAQLPRSDESVLVIGGGIVGLNVTQAVRALAPACRITVMARYPQQIAMARQLGANDVIANEDPYAATARITGAKLYKAPFHNQMLLGGFDIIYDCVGSAQSVQDALRWARAGGTVVLVGVSMEPLRCDLSPVWYQEVKLIGVMAHGMEERNGVRQSTYDLTCELLRQGKLTTTGLITHYFPLTRWQEAIRTAKDKRNGAIKVAFDYRTSAEIHATG